MSFLLGLAMFGAITFLPLYQQTVQHLSATAERADADPADARLDRHRADRRAQSPPGPAATRRCRSSAARVMTVAMYPADHAGRQHQPGHLGPVLLPCSAWAWASSCRSPRSSRRTAWASSDIGVASSSRTFFQQIGGSIGVSAFGAIFAHQLTSEMHARLPPRAPQRRRRAAQPGRGRPPARGWSSTSSSPRSRTRPRTVFFWAALTRGGGVHPGLLPQGSAAARPGDAGRAARRRAA